MKRSLTGLAMIFVSSIIFAQNNKSFYDFTVMDADSVEIKLSNFKGKKVLVVNTASKCGFTPQYSDLEKLYKTYGGRDFAIIAFPANDFMKQEPGTNSEIQTFCQVRYGVTFPVMAKISVKGKDMHPLYKWLTQKSENGVLDAPVSWNFQKFMINEKGELVGYAPPNESPLSDRIVSWIKSK